MTQNQKFAFKISNLLPYGTILNFDFTYLLVLVVALFWSHISKNLVDLKLKVKILLVKMSALYHLKFVTCLKLERIQFGFVKIV